MCMSWAYFHLEVTSCTNFLHSDIVVHLAAVDMDQADEEHGIVHNAENSLLVLPRSAVEQHYVAVDNSRNSD